MLALVLVAEVNQLLLLPILALSLRCCGAAAAASSSAAVGSAAAAAAARLQ